MPIPYQVFLQIAHIPPRKTGKLHHNPLKIEI